jgi:hypothetical protein
VTRPDSLPVAPAVPPPAALPAVPPVGQPVLQRRSVRFAGLLAVAAALGGSLAACGSSSDGPSLSSTSTSASPTASVPASASAEVAAQAKALLNRVHFAEAKLSTDYAWVANAVGTKTSVSASSVVLFVPQRKALSDAHGAMANAAKAARTAAQATPRNCPVVVSQRQAAYAAYNKGVAAYNSFVPAANSALTSLGHTTADRAAVQRAFNEVKAFSAAHPEADINMGTETSLAFAHSPADDKALTDAVHAAQTSLAATYSDLQKTRGNVANIAPTCG